MTLSPLSPPLSTELGDAMLRLRAPQPSDADSLFAAVSESLDEVGRWLPWCHANYSRADSEQWLETIKPDWNARTAFTFFLFSREDGNLLGGCGLNEIDWFRRRANLGYWVRTDETRRGVATAATRLVAQFGLERLQLQRVEIVAAIENLASQRVAEKAGARREGVLRNRLRVSSLPCDAVVYSFVPSDFARAHLTKS